MSFLNPHKKGMSPKLMRDLEGPHLILEKLLDVMHRIRGARRSMPKVMHADRLWLYHEPVHYSQAESEMYDNLEVFPYHQQETEVSSPTVVETNEPEGKIDGDLAW